MCKCTPTRRTPWCGAPGCKQPIDITIDPEKLLVVVENHGGYKGVRCICCDESGWQDRLIHKSDCPLGKTPPERPPALTSGEWDALWSWHNDREFEAARNQEYSDAQWHKQRQEAIRPFTTFGRDQKAVKVPEVS